MEKTLIVDGITKEYPGRQVLKNVSFDVIKGSIHGFLGPNGAGKSTTMKIISGIIPQTEGSLKLFGKTWSESSDELKNAIGLLPENPPLYLDMTVSDYLRFVAKIHGVKKVGDQLDKIITSLSLQDVSKRLIGNLSKGFKQRVGLAQALIYDPLFVILDEPTNGLDPEAVVELREFIRSLAKDKTILFSSHILSEVEQLCDQITIIHQGAVRATGTLEEIHKKFAQGLIVKVGLAKGDTLPSLDALGKHEITHQSSFVNEDQYQICFEDDKDCRKEISRLLVHSGVSLLTLQIEPPELENIFLHLTERV
jgi:ABC-2 type transport system ATP-binding protein